MHKQLVANDERMDHEISVLLSNTLTHKRHYLFTTVYFASPFIKALTRLKSLCYCFWVVHVVYGRSWWLMKLGYVRLCNAKRLPDIGIIIQSSFSNTFFFLWLKSYFCHDTWMPQCSDAFAVTNIEANSHTHTQHTMFCNLPERKHQRIVVQSLNRKWGSESEKDRRTETKYVCVWHCLHCYGIDPGMRLVSFPH